MIYRSHGGKMWGKRNPDESLAETNLPKRDKWKQSYWPVFYDEKVVSNTIKGAMWLSLFQAVVLLFLAFMQDYPYGFVDVGVYSALAAGFYKKSKISAFVAPAYYGLNILVSLATAFEPGGKMPNIVLVAIFMLAYINAARATLHFYRTAPNPLQTSEVSSTPVLPE